jgi:uncharacterized protein (UPF0276 family)
MHVAFDQIGNLPALGVGIGFRSILKNELLGAATNVDFVEVITEHFLHRKDARLELEQIRECYPVVLHGLGLSIGSDGPLGRSYLRAIREISELTRTPYYSEHLAVTSVPGIEIGHLTPLWYTRAMLERTVRNVISVQDFLGKPLAIENITYQFDIPFGELSQTAFFRELVDRTGCGVLLDLTNVFVNATNHRFDPLEFLAELPLDRVIQVHLAGGYWSDGRLVDGHNHPVHDEVWQLLEVLAAKTDLRGVVLERDRKFPRFEELTEEVERARTLLARSKPEA